MRKIITGFFVLLFAACAVAHAGEVEEPANMKVVGEFGGGRLMAAETSAGIVHIAHLRGTHYEMGQQYGAMLGKQIALISQHTDFSSVAGKGVGKDELASLVSNVWSLMQPHVPARFQEEIKGIVDGAALAGTELTEMDIITPIVVANISDINDKNALLGTGSSMLPVLEELAYTCSAFAAWGSRTQDGKLYSSRVLDWKPGTGTDRFKLITIYDPNRNDGEPANSYMTAGYIGFIGATNGLNDKGITVSEIGSENLIEKLDGMPWVFMFRQVLEDSTSLEEAIAIVKDAENTIGYNFVIGDGDADNYGTDAWSPRAAAIEENGNYTAVIYDNDPVDESAVWIDSEGKEVLQDGKPVPYGTPLKNAVLRADTAMDPRIRKTQTSGRGPGAPTHSGNALESGSYNDRHKSQYDALTALETGGAFNNPYNGEPVFKADEKHRLVTPDTALDIVSAAAMPNSCVLAIVYAATDLDFYVSWESTTTGEWQSPQSLPFLKLNLNALQEY